METVVRVRRVPRESFQPRVERRARRALPDTHRALVQRSVQRVPWVNRVTERVERVRHVQREHMQALLDLYVHHAPLGILLQRVLHNVLPRVQLVSRS